MNSQYNIVIRSGDKVLLELSCRWSIYVKSFLKFPVVALVGFIHCQRFQFKVSPDWHWVLYYHWLAEAADNEAELAGVLVHEMVILPGGIYSIFSGVRLSWPEIWCCMTILKNSL